MFNAAEASNHCLL